MPSSSTRPTGWRSPRRAGSAGASRGPGCGGSPPTSSAAAGRPPSLHPAARSIASSAPAAGRRRLREPPATELGLLVDALTSLAAELHGQGEELDGLSRRALAVAGHVEACLEPGEHERVVWSEADAVAWAPVDVSREL